MSNHQKKPTKPVSVKQRVVRELVKQFPDAPAMTLAKRAFRENPGLWPNVEAARQSFLYAFGTKGDASRKQQPDKSAFRKPRQPGDWRAMIPPSLVKSAWGSVEIAGPHRVLILSDVHIPFHDPEAVEVALRFGRERKPTMILLNGDIMDHYAVSRWETDPRQRDFPAEVRAGRQFLAGLRKMFPCARIVYKHGNHEERYEKYLRLKAPELLGLPDVEWSGIFGLDERRIELVSEKRPIRLGKLNVIHGHEYVFNISNPVNPARGIFLKAGDHAMCGHFHQSSNHSGTNIQGHVTSCWSMGCLCDLHPEYRPLNAWNQGFAFVRVDRDGTFHPENLKILKGRVF